MGQKDLGIIMESNSHVLHFQHAIIENFLKESLDPLSEKEMKILYQYLNKYLDYKHLPYRFLLAYSLRKITQEDVDLILSLLEEIADPKLLFRVTPVSYTHLDVYKRQTYFHKLL